MRSVGAAVQHSGHLGGAGWPLAAGTIPPPGTSRYVQGVEVPLDYEGTIPEGMERILLPEAEYLLFTGEPFAEEDYCEAIQQVQQAMDRYDPAVMGYAWELLQPRIQLEPRGERGYMELRAVKRK